MKRLCILTLVLVLSACGPENGSNTAIVSDSAGVQIVDNTEYLWPDGQGWRLSEQPLLDIGVLEGEPAYQLFEVVDSRRLSDGRIAIANSGSSEIRFFDADGKYLYSAGRKGGGPGEFESMLSMKLMQGDSLLVFDWRNQRASLLDADGNLTRATQFRFLGAMGGFPMIVAPFEDSSLLLGVRSFFGTGDIKSGLSRDEVVFVRADAEGELLDTLAVLPGGEMNVRTEGGGVMLGDRPFGRWPSHDVYRDGFYYGSRDRYEIDHYSLDGRLLRSIRRAIPNMKVSAADIENYKRDHIEDAEDENQRQLAVRLLEGVEFPEEFPAYGEIIVDDLRNIWVAVYRKPDDEQPRWTVFDSNGQLLGVVWMPERFNVHQIGSNFVLGRWQDELDIEHVRLFELIKS
jgi:hypothetical protein